MQVNRIESGCFEGIDSSTIRQPANILLRGQVPRDPQPQAARLAKNFLEQNRGILANMDVTAAVEYDGNTVDLVFTTGTCVGAIPLLSPTSGQPDYGLIVKPRFDWPGVGEMLGKTGWRVIPRPLPLPLLPRSDRKIPPWVLSSTVLLRIQAMLDKLDRRFEFTEAELSAPRGGVNWTRYATNNLPKAAFLQVPCRFPDLRDDRDLKASIHFTLKKQLAALESQRTAGMVVVQLIDLCQSLLERVRGVAPKTPSPLAMDAWFRGPLKTQVFREGLQAMGWTIDDRGLAGIADLQGLPWIMAMEEFFEAWVETVAASLVKRVGGVLKIGRKRETIAPLSWEPPYLGSQRYLLPDVLLQNVPGNSGGSKTIIFDAKYKGHWEELNRERWINLEHELRERHRADLLQVLAYANLSDDREIVSCLVYPCRKQTWESLRSRGMVFHKASLNAGHRLVKLVLAAIPMEAAMEEATDILAEAVG